MRPSLRALLLGAASALAGAGCEAPAAPLGVEAGAIAPIKRSFEGHVVALNATELRAPMNWFRIGGWNSDSSWIKVQRLVDDGTEVERGEVVAEFEFNGRGALRRVEEQLRGAEADRERDLLASEGAGGALRSSVERLAIEAKKAELDMKRGAMIAARDRERLELDRAMAAFEAGAEAERVRAWESATRAERAFRDRQVRAAKSDRERYDAFLERFKLRAPHEGIARPAFSRWRRRPVQKGDGLPGGSPVVSLARDASLGVEFYVPEGSYAEIADEEPGSFIAVVPGSPHAWPLIIDRIDRFPQELGFLREDENMPTARDKVYVVHARFKEEPEELSAGVEIKVRRP